jgi:hypothetical protein
MFRGGSLRLFQQKITRAKQQKGPNTTNGADLVSCFVLSVYF